MPVQLAYLIGVSCIYLTVRAFYRRLDPRDGWVANLAAASLGGVPIGAFVGMMAVFAGCLVLGPVQG
jgi:hypothetical protein